MNYSEALNLEIAIIGMACRFPEARNVEQFWQNLRDGRESISFFSEGDLESSGIEPTILTNPNYVKAGSVLEDIEFFDASFFGFNPREAAVMDPQQRIFLECAWEAIESAGYNPSTYKGSIGVYAGTGTSSYLYNNLYKNHDLGESVSDYQTSIGNEKDFLTTRVSYKLNLKGPSVAVQTACSTSLVAVHLACQSLLNGECDIALAGGVSVKVPQKAGYLYQEGGIASPDGHCRAFDAMAQGTVRGDGVGIVVLKKLEKALADGDCIHAVIKGSAVNNDGSLKVGYTAPSVDRQAAVIVEALAMAEIEAETVSYVEAHGTGTPLGDPVEIAALTQAFRTSNHKKGFCAIGSVKTNIGHLDAAAGVAGLIKTILALKHKLLPPSLNFKVPNPKIDFENSPFYVNTALSEWQTNETPRRAGISSFGIGGTNAHVVLEEAPSLEKFSQSRPWSLLVLSAKTSSALDTATANLVNYLKQHSALNLADMAYTLQVGRMTFNHRRMIVCHDLNEAVTAMETLEPERVFTLFQEDRKRPVAFMFPGQGTQYVNMGRELYQEEPTFQEQVDICSEILKPKLGLDLRKVLYPINEASEATAEQLKQTAITQPALFVIEYALAKLWMKWGIRPQAMIGHSIGEYVAACLAEVFSLEDALKLVTARGQLMQQLPGGSMLAVPLSELEVRPLLGEKLSLAVINGPSSCVISGSTDAVEQLERQLTEDRLYCRRLRTSHGFHSEMMTPILEAFTEQFKDIQLNPPQIPYLSNLTGTWITATEATEPNYWARHLLHTVRWSEGIEQLLKETDWILLEVGPGRTLSTLAKQHPNKATEQVVLSSLRHPRDCQSDVAFLLTTLGKLWLTGVQVDWAGFYAHERHHRLPLPTYPFERQRYWIDPQNQTDAVSISPTPTPSNTDIANWFYIPSWKRSMSPKTLKPGKLTHESLCWLVFIDECGLGAKIVKRLEQEGQDVITVVAENDFGKISESVYKLNPWQRDDYETLLTELHALSIVPTRIVHCWGITLDEPTKLEIQSLKKFQSLSFYSLLFLTQALGEQNITDSLQIDVLSNNIQSVTGEELLCPEKATLLGPVKVIPQEYRNITCRNIDIVLPQSESWQEENLIECLTAEIASNPSNLIIAYRGSYRWVQDFQAVRLEKETECPTRLRDGGVYLITGGLGSMGLAFAKYLAQKVQAKLVLTGRSELPPKNEWKQWLSVDVNADCLSHESDGRSCRLRNIKNISWEDLFALAERLEKQIEITLAIKTLKMPEREGLEISLNKLCTSYIVSYFLTSGIEFKPGNKYSQNQLIKRLNILPKFEKFFLLFMQFLQEDKIIDTKEDCIEILKNQTESPHKLKTTINERYPEFLGLVELLSHCVSNYRKALSGEIEAIEVLYPDGSPKFLDACFEKPVEYTNERLYLTLLQEILPTILQEFKQKFKPEKLRILEIGAGTGTLTEKIVEAVKDQEVEYYFTDIGKSFVIDAKKKATQKNLDFMDFGILDISKDPEEQGYEKHSFEIILGYNVVHATKSIENTVGNLKKLLATNGIIFLVESVKSQRWIDMIWGLAEGWWYFEDKDLRKNSPLLSLDKWEEVLQNQGFNSVRAYPQNHEKRQHTDSGLIIAQKAPEINGEDHPNRISLTSQEEKRKLKTKLQKLKELEDLGSDILVVKADVANLEQMRSVISQTYKRFGVLDGVIHTAGILGQGIIQLKTIEEVEKVLAPKVRGTRVLDSLLQDVKLDFLILCSSLSSISPIIGQVDYCAANIFLDAFAHYNTYHKNIFTVSIDWGFWQELGMIEKAAMPLELKNRLKEDITKENLSAAGIKAFEYILSSCTSPQVIVSPEEIQARIENKKSFIQSRLLGEVKEVCSLEPVHSRPNIGHSYTPPRNEFERRIAQIWQEVFGIQQVGIHDDFFELGGDSLLALRVSSRLRDAFQVEFPLQRFFEFPTVASLTSAITQIPNEQEDSEKLDKILKEIETSSEND